METTTITGTDKVFAVSADPIDNYKLSEYDFECTFFCNQKSKVTIKKDAMQKVDDNTYLAMVDTTKIGSGEIMMEMKAYIPDSRWEGGKRIEIARIGTGESTSR